MKTIPAYPSVLELGSMLETGETTSEAIVTELIRRAEARRTSECVLSSSMVIMRWPGPASSDRLRESGQVLGPLHGIPVVVKDNIHVAGLPNTAGTPGLANFVPASDNPVGRGSQGLGRHRAGQDQPARTRLPGITSDNGAHGAVGNPFDPAMFAGGSSGGTGAAISGRNGTGRAWYRHRRFREDPCRIDRDRRLPAEYRSL